MKESYREGCHTERYSGLSAQEAENARQQGENRLDTQKKTGVAGLFFSQFKDFMILILAIATVISAIMGDTVEAVAIIAIVLLNAVMGFLQEYKTEKTLSALQDMTAPTATLIREGRRQSLPADQVVCGDIAVLGAGDRIPADGVLLEAERMTVDESLLTGESLPQDKQKSDRVCMGTMVCSGTAVMRVDAVGMATEMGRIASLLDAAEREKTPLQQRLQQLGKVVAVACLVICIGVSLLGWARGEPLLDMLLAGISLAVAAIPEGMPAIVTIVLALSVGRILKKGAIIRRLPAVETLGCAGVICSDKTGTITQNRMAVCELYCPGASWTVRGDALEGSGGIYQGIRRVDAAGEARLSRLLRCAVLCSDARLTQEKKQLKGQGSATEVALLATAWRTGITAEKLAARYRRIKEDPFDPKRKRMSVTVRDQTGERLLCKGAPDILLRLCDRMAAKDGDRPLDAAARREINDRLQRLADDGCRVLAFAENDKASAGENGMIFLGLAALRDPPKPQVENAVRRCRRAGIKPVMITGDHPRTARAVAAQVGIFRAGDNVLTGEELERLSDEELAAVCMKTSVYARVTPQHKLRIVKAYQSCGQVAAMTGDAVMPKSAAKMPP